tara:strand:- start:2827 stop:3792 length:966 start_codon:yes stop_codon:yes gene_type:complete
MRIFITGGAGFIGSHLCEELYYKIPNSKLLILDKITYAANKKFISHILKDKKRVEFIKADLIDSKKYQNKIKNFDIAINVAAESHVDRSFNNSILFTKTNTLGAHIFFQTCLNSKIKKIIHVSTDEVYGEKTKGSFKEIDNLNPTNPYSASKAAAEIIINSYKFHFKSNILIIRGNNIYGKRQFPEKLIPSCIYNLLNKKHIKIHGNGKNIRCYLSVNDFTNAIYLLIKKNKIGIYNIGNNKYFKNLEIAKLICKKLGSNPKKSIKFINDRPFNDKRYSINISKIKRLGWKPKKNLVNDIETIVEWYKKNHKVFKNKLTNF